MFCGSCGAGYELNTFKECVKPYENKVPKPCKDIEFSYVNTGTNDWDCKLCGTNVKRCTGY